MNKLRILVVRTDRLGDVILSTPVFEVIKQQFPNTHITVMIREPIASIIEGLPAVDEVMIFRPEKEHAGFRGFLRLRKELREEKFRISIVLHGPLKLAAAVFFANIRYRVGPWSKLYSFLFFNRGLRQRRSQVEMHEADYNLQLLRKIGIRMNSRSVPVRVNVDPKAKAAAKQWLSERGWKPDSPLVIVHPGMSGSALNWPETHYIEFIRSLIKEGRQILITGGPQEVSLLNRISEALGPLKDKAIFYGNTEPVGEYVGSLAFLTGLFSFASLVVAPSTGPLHLAVAVGCPVVTFYPPIRVQSAIRWGPYLQDETRASIMVPEVYCGEDFKCVGNICHYFPCMKSLTVTQALARASHQLATVVNEVREHKENP